MRILVIAATQQEIEPFHDEFNNRKGTDVLITGVGMIATLHCLTKKLCHQKYDLVVNAGIAGAFSREIKLGTVVEVKTDEFSELGVEDEDGFSSAFEISLIDGNTTPFENGKLNNPNSGLTGLALVDGITVNTIHGNSIAINKIVKRCNPGIESMEGAAIAYVCLQEQVPFVQIRSISNYVESRNKEAWDIPQAIERLNQVLINFVQKQRQS